MSGDGDFCSRDDGITEHQKVAAIVCQDINTWFMAAENNPDMDTLELFRRLKQAKDKILEDKKMLDQRFYGMSMLYNLPKG